MFLEIKAPNRLPARTNGRPRMFLAGGITGCPDWQAEFKNYMAYSDIILINPRREDFDTSDLLVSRQQIRWESNCLNLAEVIVFWFPAETLCPITLYELGRYAATGIHIVVGTHPNYARRFDIIEQLRHAGRSLKVRSSLEALALDALNAVKKVRKLYG